MGDAVRQELENRKSNMRNAPVIYTLGDNREREVTRQRRDDALRCSGVYRWIAEVLENAGVDPVGRPSAARPVPEGEEM